MPQPVFQTERLRARPLRLDDADALSTVYSDPEVMRYVTSEGSTIGDVAIIGSLLEEGMFAPQPDPRFGFWALERREDDAMVGTLR